MSINFFISATIIVMLIVMSEAAITDNEHSSGYFNQQFYDSLHNSRSHKIKSNNRDKGVDDKCEITITTRGVCRVSSETIRPKIIVQYVGVQSERKPIAHKNNSASSFFKSLDETNATNIVDEFLQHFRTDFSDKMDPIFVADIGVFQIKNWGSVKLYELSLRGLANIRRVGPVMIYADSSMKVWSIVANLSVSNVSADFKADAKLESRVYVRGWQLSARIGECLISSTLEFVTATKLLTLTKMSVVSVNGFRLLTERLSWPFDQLMGQIIDQQRESLGSIIAVNAEKYLAESVKTVNVTQIVNKMKTKI